MHGITSKRPYCIFIIIIIIIIIIRKKERKKKGLSIKATD